MSIIFNDFKYNIKNTHALRQCDFYVLQLKKSIACLFINLDTLKMWHERLSHLSNQNVVKLIHRVDIDLFKSSSFDFCVFCEKKNETKSHKNHITFERHFDDFIRDDLIRFFFYEYNEIYYFVVWICDKIKNSQMNVLIIKNETFFFFKFFLNHIKYERNKCTRFRIDNDDEFMRNEFKNWRKFREIRIEFFIVDNSQMNDCVERLNQIFMRKINIIFKNFKLFFK